ncbi:MAG: transporter [Pedosphaera parvula]|nr:transporter [Pedosphaera parvula]
MIVRALLGNVLLAGPAVTGALEPAAAPGAGKSGYHLFNPTPAALLRPLSTDRPDKTESPYTVDAGHFQLEMDVLNYTYDRHNDARTDTRVETVAIAPVNLKLGLCNAVDFQVVLQSWNRVRTDDRGTGAITQNRGYGDTTVRAKVNLWGNDGGATALAVMPFLKLPTNHGQLGNNAFEGGVILPLAMELPHGWSMGLMTEIDINERASARGYNPAFVNTITFGHDIAGRLGGYVEFFSEVDTESNSNWIGTVDFGFTYALTDNLQFDAGMNVGVTRAADDWNPFFGISWRF